MFGSGFGGLNESKVVPLKDIEVFYIMIKDKFWLYTGRTLYRKS